MHKKGKLLIWSVIAVFLIVPLIVNASDTDSKKVQTSELQKELEAIEAEIQKYEAELSSVQSEKSTLTWKINSLRIQQNQISLEIEKTNLSIENIENRLDTIILDIESKQEKIKSLRGQIINLVRAINKKDHYSDLEILIMKPTFGEFFKEQAEYSKIIKNLENVMSDLNEESSTLTRQSEQLITERMDQGNLIAIANLQSQKLSGNIVGQRDLLSKTKAQESNYQAILADQEKRASEIKGRIYDLLGISRNITFGEAVQIAQWAQSQTGVRAALVLAILSQESNLGRNVGTCNRLGDPPEKGWKEIMKPTRDQEPFLQITEELDMDPDITPVSCPMRDRNGDRVGWGGAMGPAQFIPSTWIGYKGKVTAVTGKSANPWDIRDAFLASALLLKDNGATRSGGEWAAAMRYFSGGTNPAFSFYGDNVVDTANEYQKDIDDLM